MSEYFSNWTLIRASGFLAYYFMTLSLSFGLMGSFSIMKRKKAALGSLHQTSGWYGLLTIFFHILLIWQDDYVPYSLLELIIPFYAKNAPVNSGLGTISFYLFLLVIVSSDFLIKKLGLKNWKKLHLAVIPAWLFMLLHGIAIGTDSSEPWAIILYAMGIAIVLILGLLRYMEAKLTSQSPSARGKLNK
ncbi:ferric reductase-like transmembrane domain-containing protein [Bacillus sp. FJAT-29814]|uniref:ferric reductase-like transmembrane domain-containing protein n=1 Tax=Bacillus sp. FJAT-29814 TaxID=1729688 RepID=UPI0009ECBFCA|nr:ferric reductase-like transmembrane domain-containing protein [Bacillus sp. FJAT-29814]